MEDHARLGMICVVWHYVCGLHLEIIKNINI